MKIKIWLFLIIVLGLVLRVWGLSSLPAGFTADEASHGYDAYSLIKTGKDQWGASWPIAFRSFGDFKLPVYTYLSIPFVYFGGLNELMVRLPNALLGTGAILMVYLFVKSLFEKKLFSKYQIDLSSLPIVSALLLAISPWHIQLSRGALEANLTVFFMTAGLWAWLNGLSDFKVSNSKFQINWWWSLSALLLGINLYTYHAGRAFVLLLLPVMLWVTFVKLKINVFNLLKNNVLPILILLVFLIPMGISLVKGGSSRGLDVAIFNPTDDWRYVSNRQYEGVLNGLSPIVSRFFSNKGIYVMRKFTANYFTYLSPEFLFKHGAGENTYGVLPGRGTLYWFELPLILLTLFYSVRKPNKSLNLLLFIVLLAPIPAALSKGEGLAANRAGTMLPFVHILSAYGLVILFSFVKPKLNFFKKLELGAVVLVISLSFAFFVEDYVFHAPKVQAKGMSYGLGEAVREINKLEDSYKEIIISRKFNQPQIFLMFYGQMDPVVVQKYSPNWLKYETEGFSFVDMLGEYKLGKFTFRDIHPEYLTYPDTLVVGRSEDFLILPKGVIQTIYRPGYPDPDPAIIMIDNNKLKVQSEI